MKIPKKIRDTFLLQSFRHDCGLACLKSIYGYFDIESSIDLTYHLTPNGINLYELKRAAEAHHLLVDAYKFDVLKAPQINEVSLLVVQRNQLEHAVIVYPLIRSLQGKDCYLIGDPATGLGWINYEALCCTGILLTFSCQTKGRKVRQVKGGLFYQQLASFGNFKGELISIIFLGFLISVLAISIPIVIQQKIDQVEQIKAHYFLTFAFLIFAILIFKHVLSLLRQKLLAQFAKRYHTVQHLAWINHLSNFKSKLLKTLHHADFIKLLKEQHQRQQSNLLFFTTLFNEFILLFTWLSLAAYYSKVLAVMLLAIISVTQILLWKRNKKLGFNNEKLKIVQVHAEHEYLTYCSGIGYLSAIGIKDRFKSLVENKYKMLYEEIEKNSLYHAKVQFLADHYNGLILFSTVVLAVFYLIEQEFTKGEVLAVIMIAYYLYPTINKINAVITSYYEQIPNLSKSKLFKNSTYERVATAYFESLRISQKTDTNLMPDYAFEKQYHITKGSLFMITGINGSGKTTLMEAILGHTVLTDYECCWNENSAIKQIKDIGYVPQEVMLFNGNLRFNITLENEIDKEKISFFIQQFQLANFLAGFEFGLESEIGNGGENISGGQKRMIGILRELYRKPAVIFLDEPSVGLDESYKNWLLNVLKLLKNRMAIVCISHDADIVALATAQLKVNPKWAKQQQTASIG